jgi:hypothetical protein
LPQHLAKRPVDGSQPSVLAKGNNNATADASSDKCARDTTHLRLFLQNVVGSVFELIGALSLPRTQIRAYRWCSPPRIGCATMSPNRPLYSRPLGIHLGKLCCNLELNDI